MLPKLIYQDKNKVRSFSLNIDYATKGKQRRNTCHYSSVIVEQQEHEEKQPIQQRFEKSNRASLIILVDQDEEFIKAIINQSKFNQFFRYKDFLDQQQLEQFIKDAQQIFVSQFSSSYHYAYCGFSEGQKQIDLAQVSAKEVYEILFDFAEREHEKKYNFIYGLDIQMIHKSQYRSIFIMSEKKLDHLLQMEINPYYYKRHIYTQIQSQNESSPKLHSHNNDNHEEEEENSGGQENFYQVGIQKRNKEIKKYLIEQNKLKGLKLKYQKPLLIQKLERQQKQEKTQKTQESQKAELPQICEQVYNRFLKLFQLETLNVDKTVFSQFLLLCELSMFYTKNRQLQVSIQKLESKVKEIVLLENVLYFEFKTLRAMNRSLQSIQSGVTKAFLRFLKQGMEYDKQNRLYWKEFQRFKQYYIDKDWQANEMRLFLLLVNDESHLLIQKLLGVSGKDSQKYIFQLSDDDLKKLVFELLRL